MHMLYNSDNFVVVAFQVTSTGDEPTQARGGYEIVDKFAGKEIFLEGALAERFQQGVQALVDKGPDAEALDEFIGGFAATAQHPVVMH